MFIEEAVSQFLNRQLVSPTLTAYSWPGLILGIPGTMLYGLKMFSLKVQTFIKTIKTTLGSYGDMSLIQNFMLLQLCWAEKLLYHRYTKKLWLLFNAAFSLLRNIFILMLHQLKDRKKALNLCCSPLLYIRTNECQPFWTSADHLASGRVLCSIDLLRDENPWRKCIGCGRGIMKMFWKSTLNFTVIQLIVHILD